MPSTSGTSPFENTGGRVVTIAVVAVAGTDGVGAAVRSGALSSEDTSPGGTVSVASMLETVAVEVVVAVVDDVIDAAAVGSAVVVVGGVGVGFGAAVERTEEVTVVAAVT